MDWRPIDTAPIFGPRDHRWLGTPHSEAPRILLCEEGEVYVGRWFVCRGLGGHYPSGTHTGWMADEDRHTNHPRRQPTHWMPLPEAPR